MVGGRRDRSGDPALLDRSAAEGLDGRMIPRRISGRRSLLSRLMGYGTMVEPLRRWDMQNLKATCSSNARTDGPEGDNKLQDQLNGLS